MKDIGNCDIGALTSIENVSSPPLILSPTSKSQKQQMRLLGPVALVTMPFSSVLRPSIQLGLLKGILREYNCETDAYYLNLKFAKRIGLFVYEELCLHRPAHFGDWLFSAAAFGTSQDPDHRLLVQNESLFQRLLEELKLSDDQFRAIRLETVPEYLEEVLETMPWEKYAVVGFSCTFEQSVASFALASRLKSRWPQLVTVFGGSNFEGEMGRELARNIPCIDYAVSGEGDIAFPRLLSAIGSSRDPTTISGVISGKQINGTSSSAVGESGESPVLDALPLPDYRDYFEQLSAISLFPKTEIALPYESSRGCWWGQKHHCVFCGLNGNSMAYRKKSPDRVLRDLACLAKEYRSFSFFFVDNILDMGYLQTLLPTLVETHSDFRLFFEVKANLKKEQIELLRDAGIYRIQPGIESFSTRVLHLMRKGVSALQNVNTLRWANYYGVSTSWNLLWGFPGETLSDYQHQLKILGLITHLVPPEWAGRVRIDRFSPLFFDRKSFPTITLKPRGGYEFIYPPNITFEKIAYYFTAQYEGQLDDQVFDSTKNCVEKWRALWQKQPKPFFTFRHCSDYIQLLDARDPRRPVSLELDGVGAEVYLACSEFPRSQGSLFNEFSERFLNEDALHDILSSFCERGIMITEDNTYLSLAIPESSGR